MKAAVVKGKRLIAYEEVPTPSVQPGTLLLKTRYCSICGTDLEYVDNQMHGNPIKAGAILGHEFAAEVAAVGEGVEGWSVGDRVTTGDYLLPCGRCYFCRRQLHHLCQGKDVSPRTLPVIVRDYAHRLGAMAEYFVRPSHAVQKIPDLDFKSACQHFKTRRCQNDDKKGHVLCRVHTNRGCSHRRYRVYSRCWPNRKRLRQIGGLGFRLP